MTELLFRDDATLRATMAKVVALVPDGVLLDRTVFYATAGGQPGDCGSLAWNGGSAPVTTTVYDAAKHVMHMVAPGTPLPGIGTEVTASLDWTNRYRNMRAHTMMHLLCAAVPFPVTGGAISEDGGRIDFDIPEGQIPDKNALAARINQWIAENHGVSYRWITDEEMQANLHLVRTMSVKPPVGTGRVRLVMIGEEGRVDIQPCGGTHVAATAEIGPVRVAKIENKGKINRRIRLVFA
jgi:misacylated tRNA(Ala) deacylase